GAGRRKSCAAATASRGQAMGCPRASLSSAWASSGATSSTTRPTSTSCSCTATTATPQGARRGRSPTATTSRRGGGRRGASWGVGGLESVTDEGCGFRVDLRLRPEGRMGGVVLSLAGYRAYLEERAELWERQALIKARFCAGDPEVATRFFDLVRPFVFRPGVDPEIVAEVRGMKAQIDKSLRAKGVQRRHVKLGVGGIREVEFLVQALQLLSPGAAPWLRGPTSLRAIFRLTERGYLPQSLGRFLGDALVFLRTVEHRLQIVDEFQTHTLPGEAAALGRLARRLGSTLPPVAARRQFESEDRRGAQGVHHALAGFLAGPREAGGAAPRIPTYTALKATGFADPDRARQNLRLVLEGRPLVPYAEPMRRALFAMFPVLLEALWQSPDPDEALNQF